jgi:hypothetical protein
MSRNIPILLVCALLAPLPAMAAPARPKAATQAPAAPAATPKSTPAPVKPAPVPSPVANFDARNPSSVMAIFNLAGGKATLVDKDTDAVLLNVTSVAANFTVFFASCDAQGRACKALQFDYPDDKPGPTFAQVNAFNQTSALCRAYEDKTGKAHVVFSTLLFADAPYGHFRGQTQAWFGCIDDFRHFLKDPNGYLASAP